MKCISFYSNIDSQLKGIGMKYKRMSVGYTIKLITPSTCVSKSLHQKRYAQL
jgi:hypothetical protein